MEHKDAIYWLNNLIGNYSDYYDKALEMGVKALEQQEKAQLPQEGTTSDLISRQAAVDEVKSHYKVDNDLLEVIAYRISKLPPAEPEQKIGYWIPVHPLQADDEGAYLCSNCNTGDWDIKPTDKYCKFCGAKMQGVKRRTDG